MKSNALIGTAGWNVPRAVSGFPSEGSHLERYSAVFSAVEINSSFYRPHRRTTYERWASSVPVGFRFAVKIPRTITHEARLASTETLFERFMDEATGLGWKLGVLLAQLPPSLRFDPAMASPFFQMLGERTAVPVVCEPRHRSWFTSDADELLQEHQIARVATDPSIVPLAARPGGHKGVAYFRLHGSPRIYYSAYGEEVLKDVARQLRAFPSRVPAWCIFDNTALNAALSNARELMSLMRTLKASAPP